MAANNDIKLRLSLDAGEAIRAAKIVANQLKEQQQILTDMRKKGLQGTDEYKAQKRLVDDAKWMSKQFKSTIEDVSESIKKLSHLSIAEIRSQLNNLDDAYSHMKPGLKNNLELMREMTEQYHKLSQELAKRDIKDRKRGLADVVSDMGNAKSIEELVALGKEMEVVRSRTLSLKDAKEREAAAEAALANEKQKLVELEQKLADLSAGNDARNSKQIKDTQRAIDRQERTVAARNVDLEKAKKITLDSSQLGIANKFLDELPRRLSEIKAAPLMKVNEALEMFGPAGAKSVYQLEKVEEELKRIVRFSEDEGQRSFAATALRDIKREIKELNTAPLRDLDKILDDVENRKNLDLSQLKNLKTELESIRETPTKFGLQPQDAKFYTNRIAEVEQRMKELTTVSMDVTKAESVLNSANQELAKGYDADVAALRRYAEQLRIAKQAEGLSVKQVQELDRAYRSIDNLLREKASITMSAAEAEMAYTQAQALLANGANAEAASLARVIDLLKRAQSAEGVSIEMSRHRYAATLREVEALQRQGQTMMTIGQVQDVLNKGTQATVGEIKLAIASLEAMANAENTTAAEATSFAAKIERLRTALGQNSKAMRNTAYDAEFVRKTMANLNTASFSDLERAMRMIESELKSIDVSTKRFASRQRDLELIRQRYNDVKSAVEGTSVALRKQQDFVTTATRKLLGYLGVFGGFYMVRAQLQKAFEMNIKYDDSLSNIRKTTQMTTEAVAQLADNIKRINTRTSLEEITNLAYTAGRLGVKGTSDVMGFVRAADQINIALGEQLNGAESVESLMKITELMGVNREFGLESALLKTAASLNEISQNSTATAQPMVDFMRRLSGVSAQSGITTAELTGLAGAVNALGQPVEMSATSISKMLVQMSSNSKVVAKALKMTAEETEAFRYDIATGRMMDALLTVLRKTREAGGLSHLGTIVKDLGSEGQRVIQTIATLSQNYEKVESLVKMSTKAFEEGTSATNEYNLKNANTAALWEKLKNSFSKMFISTDAIGTIKSILVQLQDLPHAVQDIIKAFSWLGSLFTNVIIPVVTKATWAVEALAYHFLFKAAINQVVKLTEYFGKLTRIITIAATGTNHLHASMKMLGKANIFLFLADAIVSVIMYLKTARQEAMRFREELEKDLERTKTQSQEETYAIKKLVDQVGSLGNKTIERANALESLNSQYGTYLTNLFKEGEATEKVADAMKAVNAQIRLRSLAEAQSDTEKRIYDSFVDMQGEARGKLVSAVSAFMSSPNNAAARLIAEDLIKDAGKYLKVEKDESGNITGYDTGQFSAAYKAEGESESRFARLAKAFGNIYTKQSSDAGNALKVDILHALEEYMDAEAKKTIQLTETREQYGAERRAAAEEAVGYYRPAMEEYWKTVSSNVTLANRKDKRSPLIANVDASGVVRGYAEDEDADRWADLKKGMSSKEIQEEIKKLDVFINVSEQAIKDLSEIDQRQAQIWSVNRSNAIEYRKVLQLGQLEDKERNGSGDKRSKEAKDEYADIIAKIKTFYEREGEELRRQRLEGNLTSVAYERKLEENERAMHEALRAARQRIVGDISLEDWLTAVAKLVASATTENSREAAARVEATGDVRSIGIKGAKKATEEGKNGNAWLSGIRFEADKDYTAMLEIVRKRADALTKLLFSTNEIGKISEEYQERFERLGLVFDKLTGESIEDLQARERAFMLSMQRLGSYVVNYDISSDSGFAAYLQEVSRLFPQFQEQMEKATKDVAAAKAKGDKQLIAETEKVQAQLMEKVRQLYYESYEYDRAIDEAITRSVEKRTKLWTKMYKQGADYQGGQEEIQRVNKQVSRIEHFTAFGYSQITGKRRKKDLAAMELEQEGNIWQYNIDQAAGQVDAARQDLAAGVDGAEAKLAAAEEMLERVKRMPDSVRSAIDKMAEAVRDYRDANMKWLDDMTTATSQFLEAFVPFRKFDEDKGSFVRNVFGTKSERQQAAYNLIDDTKKAILAETKERVKAAITRSLERAKEKAERERRMREEEEQAKADAKRLNDIKVASETETYAAMLDIEQNFYNSSLDLRQNYLAKWMAMQPESELDITNASLTEDQIAAFQQKPMLASTAGVPMEGQNSNTDQVTQAGASALANGASGAVGAATEGTGVAGAAFGAAANVAIDKGKEKALSWSEKLQEKFRKRKKKILDKETEDARKAEADKTEVEATGTKQRTALEEVAGAAKGEIAQAASDIVIDSSRKTTQQEMNDETKSTTVSMWGNLGKAVSKAWAVGGPYLGAALAALVSAAIGALMTMVFNMMGKGSKTTTTAPSSKLVSGMLTYDRGNAQLFVVPAYDDGTLPVMASNGKIYSARQVGRLGTGMVTSPTLTTIGGLPALVGEEGPEMVIGRETTHALQMARPDILRIIQDFDARHSRGYTRAYDAGNVSDFPASSGMTPEQASHLSDTLNQLAETLASLQRNGVAAHINKYGRGGLIDEVTSGVDFTRKLGDRRVNRVFNR